MSCKTFRNVNSVVIDIKNIVFIVRSDWDFVPYRRKEPNGEIDG